jgi:hypothetical protein
VSQHTREKEVYLEYDGAILLFASGSRTSAQAIA